MKDKMIIKNKMSNYIFILLFFGLLLLRFPFIFFLTYHKIPILSDISHYIYYDGMYLITAVIIIVKRDSLSDYNIDFSSLLIFIIAPVAELFNEFLSIKAELTDAIQADPFKIIISVCLFIVLLVCRPKLCKRSTKSVLSWILIAAVVGICTGIFNGIILDLQESERLPEHPNVYLLIYVFIIQLSNAAIIVEPFFRGFLWGLLKSIKWKDSWIWLFQAVLFWLGHIYYLGLYNYSFWILVPLSALTLGLLVWRSRSISTSMIAHGLSNSIGDSVAHYTW